MGEICRRWAGILATDQLVGEDKVEEGEFSKEDDGGVDETSDESEVD